MHNRFSLTVILLIIITGFIQITSCTPKKIGYGVVLWSTGNLNIENGTTVSIYEESEIRNTYIIGIQGSNGTVEIPKWQIAFFKKPDSAEDYKENYSEYKNIYAITLNNGHPIREKAENTSDRVYKLKEGEIIKIIEKLPEKIKIGEKEGFWYYVLTEEGISGYCFDTYLKIYNSKTQKKIKTSSLSKPLLDTFLQKSFRPEKFIKMIQNKAINLSEFTERTGVFPNPENKTVSIVKQKEIITFNYTDIVPSGLNEFSFESSPLEVNIISGKRVVLHYTFNNKEYNDTYVYIENMQEIIDEEIERRDDLYNLFLESGTLSSSAYGKIEFLENRQVKWINFRRLVPEIIPEQADTTGTAKFQFFLSDNLQNSYDGVISFHFNNTSLDIYINFLYSFSDKGVKFVYIPQYEIKDNIALEESSSPIVIFFSFRVD